MHGLPRMAKNLNFNSKITNHLQAEDAQVKLRANEKMSKETTVKLAQVTLALY